MLLMKRLCISTTVCCLAPNILIELTSRFVNNLVRTFRPRPVTKLFLLKIVILIKKADIETRVLNDGCIYFHLFTVLYIPTFYGKEPGCQFPGLLWLNVKDYYIWNTDKWPVSKLIFANF